MEQSQVFILLSLGVLLATARILGETTRSVGMTAVLGEILAGVLLGPTCFGAALPDLQRTLFPLSGPNADVLNGIIAVAIALFLMTSGMEVNLSSVVRQGKTAIFVSTAGMLLPFSVGVIAARSAPSFLGMGEQQNFVAFTLFWGCALSISALPVIAKTLMDLNLYRTDLGMIVMPAAVIQDVAGWCVFAVVLSMIGENPHFTIVETVGATLLFAAFMLTVGRKLFDSLIPWISAHWAWPGGIIGTGSAIALTCAAFTEWLGIHALFGAFFCGIALGDSKHMSERTRFAFDAFIANFFAPVFFASIGLKVDFAARFDAPLVLIVILIATIGKIGGSLIGGIPAGLSRRDALAVGYAMNARGAMEIILGIVALKYALITEKAFVALVIMAIATSLASGPMIKRVLRLKRRSPFTRYIKSRSLLQFEEGVTRAEAVHRLIAGIAKSVKSIDEETAFRAVIEREAAMHTGIGNGLALPHARIEGISAPMIAVGISRTGIDFDAPDGIPARIVILVLEPEGHGTLPLEIYADIAESFSIPTVRNQAIRAGNLTEFIAAVRTAVHG